VDLCVAGAGYVGLVTSACFADLGHSVVCVDRDHRKIAGLKRGKVPIYEPGLEEIIRRNLKQRRLAYTSSWAEGLRKARVVFICVGTPMKAGGEPDLSQIESAARDIGAHLKGRTIVVNKSTVPVGMGDLVASILRESKGARHGFSVASCPEFLREGSAIHDFLNPDRIVIGASDAQTAQTVAKLFRPIKSHVLITDVRSAETIKYASNAFLATKISFINEIAALCDRVGADVSEVAKGMGLDKRIGGAFLSAGAGFGGSCFPKDTHALIHVMERERLEARLLKATLQVNEDQKRRVVDKVKEVAGPLEGKTIAIWGLAFKANTDDMREAVSVDIIAALRTAGARVKAYDPEAMPNARRLLPDLGLAKDPYDAVKNADALLILTEWNQFKEVDLTRVRRLLRGNGLVDGRNILDPKVARAAGFQYRGIGRS
jgi:UDPglucose 6-dehydrogenase